VRRIGERLAHSAHLAQAAVPEAVSSTVGTTAAPVVSSGVGERVVAAGMTLLLAGGVTVGAAKIVRGGNQDKPAARAVASAPAPAPAPAPDTSRVRETHPPADHPASDRGRTGNANDTRAEPPIVEEPEPTPVVEVSEIIEASPSPDADPSPEPSVEPPPPAPEWTMSFGSDLLGDTSWLSLVNSTVQGKVGTAVRYSQTVTGSLVGSKRELTRISLEYWGSAQGKTGNAEVRMFLDTPAGSAEYRASASLESVNLAQDGSAVYRFTGSYALTTAPVAAQAIMPHEGKITLTLKFWSDGSLYASAIELVEGS
jgi:hypothetical protein